MRALAIRAVLLGALTIPACGDSSPAAGHEDAAAPADGGAPGRTPDAMAPDPTEKVFDLGRLHEIAIAVAPEYLDTLDTWTPEQPRVPCTFTFDGVAIARAGIRRKGGSTWGSAKPGYSVKLDEYVTGQELFGLDRLLLDSAGTDPSFLHEHLGYELYRSAGLPARRTAHAAVTFNGVDKGLFVVAEAHDKKFLRRTFGDGNQGGNLYEGWCCFDFVSRTDRIDLKGEVEEMRGRDDLDALIAIILDAPDDRFEELVTARLDLSGFITGYAVDAAVVHWDGYSFQTNNYYLYDDPADGRFVFLPHGMDQLLGDLAADPFVRPKGRLSQRIREIPALDARFRAEVYRVVDEAWDLPALLARIDQVAAILQATPRSGEATLRDLDSFDRNLGPTREALARRKQTLQDNRTAVCGDGVIQGVEQCDDGNAGSEDGCSVACRREWCGDRIVQPGLGEACDDPGCLPDRSGPGRCGTLGITGRWSSPSRAVPRWRESG